MCIFFLYEKIKYDIISKGKNKKTNDEKTKNFPPLEHRDKYKCFFTSLIMIKF